MAIFMNKLLSALALWAAVVVTLCPAIANAQDQAARRPLAGSSVVYRRSTLNCGIFGAESTAESADRGCTAANEFGDVADNEP